VPYQAINLTFHGVGDQPRHVEPDEADVWVSRERLDAILDALAGRDDVRVTFDDGNASDVRHGLPALQARGLRGSFFVVAGRVGTPGYLDRADVRSLVEAGMTIGSHGMAHRPWRGLDEDTLRRELVESKDVLEEIVGGPVDVAACPFGSYDRRVLSALRSSGYRHVFTSDQGTARPDDWLQARNTVHRMDGAELLHRIVSARGTLRRRAKLTAKRWR
jgi:peptidoglycan/xylan/chitin deacetylase (PgdA/CDA1 family)